jgi:hypothetical protein
MEMEMKEPVVKSLLVQMSKRMGNRKRNLFPLFYIQASPPPFWGPPCAFRHNPWPTTL